MVVVFWVRVQCTWFGFSICGLGFMVWDSGLWFGFSIKNLGLVYMVWVYGLVFGFIIYGLGLRSSVYDKLFGFRAYGLGYIVQDMMILSISYRIIPIPVISGSMQLI